LWFDCIFQLEYTISCHCFAPMLFKKLIITAF